MNVLVIDIGGTSIKVLATGQQEAVRLSSGPTLSPAQMVAAVRKATSNWNYDAVSIGYPGPVLGNRVTAEPHNLGPGWIGFDFEAAFGRPVKLINDAALQALGSYKGGKMLFLGLGTGLGSSLIVNGSVEPMELGHLQESHLRRLCRRPRIKAVRKEKMAALRCGHGKPPVGRAST
jgi:polyphosphate glucokinase